MCPTCKTTVGQPIRIFLNSDAPTEMQKLRQDVRASVQQIKLLNTSMNAGINEIKFLRKKLEKVELGPSRIPQNRMTSCGRLTWAKCFTKCAQLHA